MLGADRLRGDTLDRLSDACESTGTGLVLAYRSIPPHVRQRLGRGNAAVAYMRLGNAEDAKAASEQLGTEHRFVLSQLTETIGLSVTDTTASATPAPPARSSSAATSLVGQRRLPPAAPGAAAATQAAAAAVAGTSSRSAQTSDSRSTGESDSVSTGINSSTAWGLTTIPGHRRQRVARPGLQRSREFLVEQHELQQLPASAMIITYAGSGGRQVVLADANPGIGGLRAATQLTLEEFRDWPAGAPAPPAGPGSLRCPRAAPARPAGWRSGDGRPAPNLGPPPPRLDWRKRRC